MVEKILPSDPVLPWHAIFTSPTTGGADSYRAARSYGDTIVDLGFCTSYFILNKLEGGRQWIHCLPYSGGSTLKFIPLVLDRNWGCEYTAMNYNRALYHE
jgi:hypothetical protein